MTAKWCDVLNQWVYHPVDPELVCENRTKRLSECCRCRGLPPIRKPSPKIEIIPKLIPLNVDREAWVEGVWNIQDENSIVEGNKKDETSSRRIAILLGELYLTLGGSLSNAPIVEKDGFDLAMEYRLRCDPLERELRIKKPNYRRMVLNTWGVDKTSGMEGYTTQLKEWTVTALLDDRRKEAKNGDGVTGDVDRGGAVEDDEAETVRAEIFENRKRNAFREDEQGEKGIS